MALLDKMKQQAAQVAQKAQEAGRAGQAKIEEVQARRQLDALYRDLGAATYAQHAGRGDQTTSSEIERLYGEVAAWEQEHGEASAEGSEASDSPGASSQPEGDFKLE
ncbi:MAG: hypothetical protein WB770_11970 [Acidimicrobiales bacterium]